MLFFTSNAMETSVNTAELAQEKLAYKALKERVHLFVKQLPTVMGGLSACVLAIGYMVWEEASPMLVTGWVAAVISFGLLRVFHIRMRPREDATHNELERWFLGAKTGVLLSGLIWGVGSVLMFPEISMYLQFFVVVVTGGLIGGAISSYGTVAWLPSFFAIPAALPPAIYFLLQPDSISRMIGVLICVYLLTTALISRSVHQAIVESLTLRVENESLLQDLQSSEAKFRGMVEGAIDGILIVKNDSILYANQALADMVGYELDEVVGSRLEKFFMGTSSGREQLKARAEATHKGIMVPIHYEIELRRKDGELCQLIVSSTRFILDGEVAGIGMVKDITYRKKAEKELVLAKERAEDATRLKDRFVSLVAHDLKSPLSSMLGISNLLITDQETPLLESQRKLVALIQQSGKNLIQTIEELLNLDRMQAGHIVPIPRFFGATESVGKVKTLLGYLAEEKEITLIDELPESVRLFADPELFAKVIQNVLSNAVKFCDRGDKITISLASTLPKAIVVKDTGRGMPPEAVEELFQGDRTTSRVGTAGERGTGRGLAFCREIMEAHGGEILVDSKSGEGTEVTLRFPEEVLHILLVGGSASFENILTQKYDAFQVTFHQAETGEQALQILEQHPIHMVIADQQLPGAEDGLKLLPILKRHPRTVSVPLIFLIDPKDANSFESALRLGATDVMAKPLPGHEFAERLRVFQN